MGGRQLSRSLVGIGLAVVVLAALAGWLPTAWAANPAPQSGSVGLQGTVPAMPPAQAATITAPSDGAVFTALPITVSGSCPTGLLVKIFDNNIFVGSAVCSNGRFSLQIDLFNGRNDLVARVYDALDQAGPDSNTVTVTLNNAQSGLQLSLTSAYAERGAPPGTELDWPVLLNGGTGPYAISVDWGDRSPPDLFIVADAGTINLKHVYKAAGIYNVVVRVTDKNGNTALLYLVGQGTGAVQHNISPKPPVEKDIIWWPALAASPLLGVAYWIGYRQGRHSPRPL